MNVFSRYLMEYVDAHVQAEGRCLRRVQEKMLYSMLGMAAVVFLLPYFLGVSLAANRGYLSVVIIDTMAYVWILYLLWARGLSYKQRVYGLLGLLGFLGISLLILTGNQGAGWLWLFLVPIFATLFLDRLVGYRVVAIVGLLLFGIGVLGEVFPGRIAVMDEPLPLYMLIASNYLALVVMVVYMMGHILTNLGESMDNLRARQRELELTQAVTVDAMASLAEYRDVETGNHIIRTRHYVNMLARQLQQHSAARGGDLDDKTIRLLSQSAPLHDVGKIGVPDDILLKPGRLTEEEFEEMKKHTEYGHEALIRAEKKLGSNHFLNLAAEIAWTHHEKWDGSGYPRGISGEDIPLSGRIMAVADVYDALISRRVYKEASSHEEALAYIEAHSGKQFDPEVVKALQAIAEDFRAIALKFSDQ